METSASFEARSAPSPYPTDESLSACALLAPCSAAVGEQQEIDVVGASLFTWFRQMQEENRGSQVFGPVANKLATRQRHNHFGSLPNSRRSSRLTAGLHRLGTSTCRFSDYNNDLLKKRSPETFMSILAC